VVVDERHGRTFVIHRSAADPTSKPTDSPMNDQVTVLDAGSGQVLRTLSVGRFAVALAVDETRGRLFVLNTNIGCRRPPSVWTVIPGAVRHWLPFVPKLPRPVCTSQGSVSVIDTSRV
jgi:DNA-binding beta-propeller fold protein YncE